MDFGKLPSVDNVDFSLLPEPSGNAFFLQRLPAKASPANIYIGPTGYNQKEWVGQWYPASAKENSFLRFFGEQFNTIEHNTTHYRLPDAAAIQKWRQETPEDFRFCPKMLQTISHSRNIGQQDPGLIRTFLKAISDLGDRLGVCFMQLPPYFSIAELHILENFLRHFASMVPLAIEVRHPSFFQKTPSAEAYFDLLEKYQTAAVITDVAGRRDVCHMRVTAEHVLIRFVGNGLHPTDYSRIDAWAERLAVWINQGLRAVYFFGHEPGNILAPDLCAYAAQRFSAAVPSAVLRGPTPVNTAGGIQTSLF